MSYYNIQLIEIVIIVFIDKSLWQFQLTLLTWKKCGFIKVVIWWMLQRFAQKYHFIFCGAQIY